MVILYILTVAAVPLLRLSIESLRSHCPSARVVCACLDSRSTKAAGDWADEIRVVDDLDIPAYQYLDYRRDGDYQRINSAKFPAILAACQTGPVLYVDTDVVFLGDPVPSLSALPAGNYFQQYDNGSACAGVGYFSGSDVFGSLAQIVVGSGGDDEVALRSNAAKAAYGFLDPRRFCGWWTRPENRREALLLHFAGAAKLEGKLIGMREAVLCNC